MLLIVEVEIECEGGERGGDAKREVWYRVRVFSERSLSHGNAEGSSIVAIVRYGDVLCVSRLLVQSCSAMEWVVVPLIEMRRHGWWQCRTLWQLFQKVYERMRGVGLCRSGSECKWVPTWLWLWLCFTIAGRRAVGDDAGLRVEQRSSR